MAMSTYFFKGFAYVVNILIEFLFILFIGIHVGGQLECGDVQGISWCGYELCVQEVWKVQVSTILVCSWMFLPYFLS